MSELHLILQDDSRVQDAIIALGDQDEEVHWAAVAKQYCCDGKKHKVFLGLTHLALYIFDRDETWQFITGKWGGKLHCRVRVPTSQLTGISEANGGRMLALENADEIDSVVVLFSKRDPTWQENAALLLEEITRMHEDETGDELEVKKVEEYEARKILTASWKEERQRMVQVAKQVKVQKRRRLGGAASSGLPSPRTDVNETERLDMSVASNKAPSHADSWDEAAPDGDDHREDPGHMPSKSKLGKITTFFKRGHGDHGASGDVSKKDSNRHAGEEHSGVDGAEELARLLKVLKALDGKGGKTKGKSADEGWGEEPHLGPEEIREYTQAGFNPDRMAGQWIKMGLKGALTSSTSIQDLERRRDLLAAKLRRTVHDSYRQFINASREIANVQEEIVAVRHHLSDTLEAITQLDELPDAFEDTVLSDRADGGGRRAQKRLAYEGGLDLQQHSDEVLELLDDLDGRIVEQRFDAAVECIEHGWASLAGQDTAGGDARILEAELRERVPLVVKGIWEQVENPSLTVMRVMDAVALLTRLRQKENAMELFLSLRTQFLEREIAKLDDALKEERDMLLYVGELCNLLFSCIMQTANEFKALFKDRALLSSLLSWASLRLTVFDDIFRAQIFPCGDYSLIGECAHLTRQYCSLLNKSGISLDFQLNGTLLGPLHDDLARSFQGIRDFLLELVKNETWQSIEVTMRELKGQGASRKARHETVGTGGPGVVLLTNSAQAWYSKVASLFAKLSSTLGEGFSAELGGAFEDELWRLAGWYCSLLSDMLDTEGLSDTQQLCILGDGHYLLTLLLPDILHTLPGQPPPSEQEEMWGGWGDAEALLAMRPHGESGAGVAMPYVAMWTRFVKGQVEKLRTMLCWEVADYTMRDLDEEQARPSEQLQRLFAQAGALGDAASEHLGVVAAREMLCEAVGLVIEHEVLGEEFWDRYIPEGLPCRFGNGGVQQFVLDIRYALAASAGIFPAESSVRDGLAGAVEKAVIAYCVAMDEDLDSLLQSDEWHDHVIRNTLLAMSSMLDGLFIDRADLSAE